MPAKAVHRIDPSGLLGRSMVTECLMELLYLQTWITWRLQPMVTTVSLSGRHLPKWLVVVVTNCEVHKLMRYIICSMWRDCFKVAAGGGACLALALSMTRDSK
eukprot:TRINITY_DN28693_c0_g2_i6.p2 TRINITY_DN28693_c0_g2~~TRINITY_DN28693_c0_g2_i6.p2  ORF type:complete len:103 (-),score=1.63 TRINITY_DN28693_c0_g2_i6:167-475(-)